MAIINH